MKSEDIIQIVCDVCEITPDDLRKRSRKEPLPTARALIAHFLYRELNMMPREIFPLIGHPLYSRTASYYYLGRRTFVEERIPHQRTIREKAEQIRVLIDSSNQSCK